jgi:ABC-type transport system involved in multi-copper enzyme maturation permease subunit
MSDSFGLALWDNAVLHRELASRLRSPRTFLVLVLVAFASSGLVLLRWPTDTAIDIVSQGTILVFRPVAFTLTLAVMMLVPAFPASSLVSERRRGTLGLLLNSPLRPVQVYLGKLVSNVLLSLILISVSLPALGACYAMGGVSLVDHILPLLLVLAAMAIQYSAIGLWVSVRAASTDASLRTTYVMVLILAVLSVGPLVVTGNVVGPVAALARLLTSLSPLSALQELTSAQAAVSDLGLRSGWQAFLVASLVIAVVCGVLTVRKLDPRLLDRPRPMGRVRTGNISLLRRLTYLIDPQQRKAGIPFWLNPILVKEFRTRKFGRLHWLLRLVAVCAIVSLLLTVVAATGTVNWGVERIAGPLVLLQISLLMLVGPSLGANLIAAEVESGGWQLLRVAPISPLRILSGKLMSVLWTLLLILLATLPGYLVMGYIQPALVGQVGNVIVSLLLAIVLVVCISSCISAFCRTAAVATATSYGVLLLLFAGTLLVWLARGRPFGPIFVERVLLFNPAAMALSEMQAPGFEAYRLTPAGWWICGGISLACLVILLVRTWRLTRPD